MNQAWIRPARTPASLILFLAFAFPASAQQAPAPAAHADDPHRASQEPTPTIKVHVNQVLVPVVVTDKNGHNIVGLKRSDFAVFENGVQQNLLVFQTGNEPAPYDAPSVSPDLTKPPAPAAHAVSADGNPSRRTYLVCLDTINSSFENFTYVRGALRKLFKQEQEGDSLYAILTVGRTLAMPQNPTRDPAAVLAAIGSKELTRAILQSESSNLKTQQGELSMMLGDYCGRCPCAGAAGATGRTSGGSNTICDGNLQKIEMWAGAAAEERSMLTRAFLRNLYEVVERLSRMPGKRIIVLVSDGFNTHPGRDLFGMIAAYTGKASELLNGSINDAEPQIQAILRVASAHDIAFYTLDSRGVSASDGSAFDASEESHLTRDSVTLPQVQQRNQMTDIENQAPLAELAEATGGVLFRNNNDLFKGLRQAFADGREYYLLAYVSTNQATDGKFREIKVNVKGKNLTVRAKRGYWAPSN